MGLDTYAISTATRKPLPETLFAHIPPVLAGGIFSGNGSDGSFRGKVYSNFIETVTGVHLYQEQIPHDQVVRMAESLQNWIHNNPDLLQSQWEITETEIRALAEWFAVVAGEPDAVAAGWW